MLEKILVPIDGSEESIKAAHMAKAIADKFNSRVTLLYVLMPVSLVATAAPGEEKLLAAIPDLLDFRRKEGEKLLNESLKIFGLIETTPKILEGHPARTIINYAKEEGFDIIIMGSRGLSRIAGFFLGSVSDAVVHHAHCPVLLVR